MLYRWSFINIKLLLTLLNAQLLLMNWVHNGCQRKCKDGKTQLSLLSLCDT